jgi:hypothetical protein
MGDFSIMNALKSHGESVELQAGNRSNIQIPYIPSKDLETILAAAEN